MKEDIWRETSFRFSSPQIVVVLFSFYLLIYKQ